MKSIQNFLELASKGKVESFEIRNNKIFAHTLGTRWEWVLFQDFDNSDLEGIFNLKLTKAIGQFTKVAENSDVMFPVIDSDFIPLSKEDIKHFNNSFTFTTYTPTRDRMFGVYLENDNLVTTNGMQLYTAKLSNKANLYCTIPVTDVLKYFFGRATEISYHVMEKFIQFNFTWNNEKFGYVGRLNIENYPLWKMVVEKYNGFRNSLPAPNVSDWKDIYKKIKTLKVKDDVKIYISGVDENSVSITYYGYMLGNMEWKGFKDSKLDNSLILNYNYFNNLMTLDIIDHLEYTDKFHAIHTFYKNGAHLLTMPMIIND